MGAYENPSYSQPTVATLRLADTGRFRGTKLVETAASPVAHHRRTTSSGIASLIPYLTK